MEIPSGALADRWSRKWMLTLAPLIKALCFLSWFFAGDNFYLFALGFFFWGTGSSFVSGTTEALLYDTLKHYNQTDDYEKILGRKKLYFYIALATSGLLGGIIAQYNIDGAILLSILPLLLSAYFAYHLNEIPRIMTMNEAHYLEYIRDAWKEIKTNRTLLYLFFYAMGISILGDLEEFDQLYYKLVNLPFYAFGVVSFIWSILNGVGSFYAYRLKSNAATLYILPLLGSVSLLLVALCPGIPMIAMLLLSYMLASPAKVLIDSRIQHSITTDSRATVTSAGAFINNLFGILLIPFLGILGRIGNLLSIYKFTALFLLSFSIWAFLIRKKLAGR